MAARHVGIPDTGLHRLANDPKLLLVRPPTPSLRPRQPAPEPFRYRDWGSMATIGRSAAVAEIGGSRFTGFFAWLLWGLVHITYLIGLRNRVVVTIKWLWAWITYAKGARLITGPSPAEAGIKTRTADATSTGARRERREGG